MSDRSPSPIATWGVFVFAVVAMAARAQVGAHAPLQDPTGVTAPAAVPPAEPKGLTHYMGRKIAVPMSHLAADWLIRNSREIEENTTRMLEALALKSGQVVCDFGCGNGYLTLRMMPMVGDEGCVYGTEIQPEMLVLLEERRTQLNV